MVITHKIRSLGQIITYNPDKVLNDLKRACKIKDEHELVRELYHQLGLSPQSTAGIIATVYAGRHVNTIVIQAWCQLKKR